MAFEARGFGVIASERKPRDANVVKALRIGLKCCGAVTVGTFFYRRGLGELPGVFVFVAAFTFAWRASKGGGIARLGARPMAARAGGFFVRTFEWPGRVVDLGLVPVAGAVTVGAAAAGHFFRELDAMRIFVALDALPLDNFEGYPRPCGAVTATAGRCNVFAIQRKHGGFVFNGAKQRRAKASNVMALCTFTCRACRELTIVLIFVTRRARIERELAVARFFGQRLEMAFCARGISMFALQWIRGFSVGIAANFVGHAKPFDRTMAIIAVFTKRRFVHNWVAAHALFAFAWRLVVAFVVTAFTFDIGVAVGQR